MRTVDVRSDLTVTYCYWPSLQTFTILEGLDKKCLPANCSTTWDHPHSPDFHIKSPFEIIRLPTNQNVRRALGLPHLTFHEGHQILDVIGGNGGEASLAWEVDWSEETRGTEASLGIAILTEPDVSSPLHTSRYLSFAAKSVGFHLSSSHAIASSFRNIPFGLVQRSPCTTSTVNDNSHKVMTRQFLLPGRKIIMSLNVLSYSIAEITIQIAFQSRDTMVSFLRVRLPLENEQHSTKPQTKLYPFIETNLGFASIQLRFLGGLAGGPVMLKTMCRYKILQYLVMHINHGNSEKLFDDVSILKNHIKTLSLPLKFIKELSNASYLMIP